MTNGLPLVLISQVQRSGGTLLSQLLDGHPQCAVYPHELKIGRPRKWDWPDLALDATPADWFARLCHPGLARMAVAGYRKAGSNRHARGHVLPFSLSLEHFERSFVGHCRTPASSQREILEAYLTAFFTAWTDHVDTGREQVIVAFTPRVQMAPASMERLRRDYPDGRLLTIVRDPVRWFASACRHDPAAYGDVDAAIELWRASAEASLGLAATKPDCVRLVLYEDLVGATRETMASVARFLGIAWNDSMLTPTYCGQATLPNSSFDIAATGISHEPLHRKIDLPARVADCLAAALQPVYARAALAAHAAAG